MTTINKYSRWIGGVAYLVNAYIHSELYADNLYIVTVDDLDHVDSIEEIETTAEDLEIVFNDTVKKYQDIYDASRVQENSAKSYSDELIDFLYEAWTSESLHNTPHKITANDAAATIREWIAEGWEDLPADLSPESFADLWNNWSCA